MLSTQPDQGLQKQAQPTTMSPSRAEPSPSAADASGGGGGTCWSRCVLIMSYVFLIPRPNKLLVDSSDKRHIKPLIIIFREMTGQKVTSSPTRTCSRLQAVNGPRPPHLSACSQHDCSYVTSEDTGEGLRVSEKKKKNKHLQHTAGGSPVQGALFTVQHTGVPVPCQEFLQGSKSRRSWQKSKVLYYTG